MKNIRALVTIFMVVWSGASPFCPSLTNDSHLRSLARTSPSDGDLFDAQEAAAFDAHDISDAGVESAAMERAVIMAYEMMAKKKKELKTKLEDVKTAEEQYAMMEAATEDLARKYRENVSAAHVLSVANYKNRVEDSVHSQCHLFLLQAI